MTHGDTAGAIWQVHLLLALGIMAGYAVVPFTALRRLPLTRPTRVFAVLFFGTCAITHLAIAAGAAGSMWMIANDAVQLVAVIGFIRCLSRQVAWTLRRRQQQRSGGRP